MKNIIFLCGIIVLTLFTSCKNNQTYITRQQLNEISFYCQTVTAQYKQYIINDNQLTNRTRTSKLTIIKNLMDIINKYK